MSFSEADADKPLQTNSKSSAGQKSMPALAQAALNKPSSNSQKSTPTLIQAPLNKTVTGATSLITRTTADNIGASTGPNKSVTGATTLLARTTADNIGANTGPTLMVLTTSSVATTNQNGALNIASSGSNPGTLAVKTATSSGGIGGAKTIVVMPVSNNFGSGDGATAKRFKIE